MGACRSAWGCAAIRTSELLHAETNIKRVCHGVRNKPGWEGYADHSVSIAVDEYQAAI